MKAVVILFTLIGVIYTEAFDCGIHMNRNEVLKTTINKCVSSNRTLEDLWNMAPMSSESDSSSSSDEQPSFDSKMMKSFKNKRSLVGNETELEQNTTENSQSAEKSTESCIIQCIFENFKMTDNNGYPIHTKILEGLLKNVTSRELKDFLQDSTDECFQEMDKEETMDPCAYSIKLVSCLADKGKTNCSDWPVGDLPFH